MFLGGDQAGCREDLEMDADLSREIAAQAVEIVWYGFTAVAVFVSWLLAMRY